MKATGPTARMLVEAEAAAYGIRNATDSHGKVRWFVTCSLCGKQSSVFNPSVNDANWLVTHFNNHGWVFDRKTARYCSTRHAREAKNQQRQERKEEETKQMNTQTPTPPPPPSTAGPDPKIVVAVVRLLEEHFDTTTRRYRGSESDETIAKKTGASLDFVRRYRKDAYGELAEDPQITQFRADLKAMDDLYHTSLDSLKQSFNKELAEMAQRLERLMALRPKAGG